MTLEELLNKLIEMWWKPWNTQLEQIRIDDESIILYRWLDNKVWCGIYSINDLCSIDSWLWQFVVEKELIDSWENYINVNSWYGKDTKNLERHAGFRYRLMLSSIQTDKEKFLLDNIKI